MLKANVEDTRDADQARLSPLQDPIFYSKLYSLMCRYPDRDIDHVILQGEIVLWNNAGPGH